MPQKADHTAHILEGKAILYKRVGTPHWQVRYKANGKWLRATTKQTELTDAKAAAVELVMNAWYRAKNDLPVITKRFKSVANTAIERMEAALEAEHGKITYVSYIRALKNYHIPFLGQHNIDKITYSVLKDFEHKRIVKMGKVPTASTLNTHNSALNRVFDVAVELGFMTKSQVPELQNAGTNSNRRADITIDEYNILCKGMRAYIRTARDGYEREIRLLLRDYVLILANTGIRPGTEAMNLKWQHIAIVKNDGKPYLSLNIKGKTKKWRRIQVRHRVARYLQRIQQRGDTAIAHMTFEELLAAGIDKRVFTCGDTKDLQTALGRVFTRMLESCGLLMDKRTEQNRTLYSLRHFYATHELTKGNVTAYQLSEQMGTSVQMLEQHYGHLDLLKLADKFAGRGSVELTLQRTPAKTNKDTTQ
jgi:integrase